MDGASKKASEMFYSLPKDCISHIFSFRSPLDICNFATYWSHFQSMADLDEVLAQFLPSMIQLMGFVIYIRCSHPFLFREISLFLPLSSHPHGKWKKGNYFSFISGGIFYYNFGNMW